MVVGRCKIELLLRESQSLKDKRMILQRIKKRIHNEFNVSIAEVENNDLWQRVTFGVAVVGNDKRFVNGILSRVIDTVRKDVSLELIDYSMEIQ